MEQVSDTQLPLAPKTTHQEDLVVAGQRKVNIIWEFTQASIALGITFAVIYSGVAGIENQELRNAFFLVIGFYFSRTNHQAIGGIGDKPKGKYQGR